jgi:hypothetical protein
VDADAKVDMTVGRQVRIGPGQRCLRFDGALDGVNGAAELRQYAVPSGISNPAAMRGDQAIQDGSPLGQVPEGTDLIGPHQAAVTLDIGSENRNQSAFCFSYFRQNTPLNQRNSLSRDEVAATSKIECFCAAPGKASMSVRR